MSTRTKNGKFRVGDWVTFPYGFGQVVAQVIEDRGPLGVNRRRLYRVRLDMDSTEPHEFELPEDEVAAVPLPDKTAVLDYLKGGGLLAILRSNLGGGKEQPRVWLTYMPHGEVTHTFLAERGVIGGEVVPYFALHEEEVATGKVDEVIRFLASFGLTRHEAREVLETMRNGAAKGS